MKQQSLFKKATLVAALTAASFAASAGVKDLGTVPVGAPVSFSNADFVAPPGPFADVFKFMMPANGGSGYSVIDFPLDLGMIGTFSTAFSAVKLFGYGVDNTAFTIDDVELAGGLITPSQPSYAFTFGPSAGGSYYLAVTGVANGSLGGLYNGSVSVTAVPEPESYAMLLAGLGVMGAIAMRRNKRKSD